MVESVVLAETPDSKHNDDVWTHLLREDFHTHPYQNKTTHQVAWVTVRIQYIKDIVEIAFLHSYVKTASYEGISAFPVSPYHTTKTTKPATFSYTKPATVFLYTPLTI